MKKLQKMINKITLMSVIILSNCSVILAQSKKYDPYYYPKLGEYVDSKQIDFSSEYKKWLIPDNSEKFVDITHELLGNGYVFERALFNSEQFTYENIDSESYYKETSFNGILGDKYTRIEIFIHPEVERIDSLTFTVNGKTKVGKNESYYKETSFNGILGDKYTRIEIFIHPEVERIDSLTFTVNGKTKVGKNICDFIGEIFIEHIFKVWERANDPDSPNYYVMVCNYLFTEDKEQFGTGFFKGTYGAYCYIDEANKKVCLDIDAGGGELNNRNYVGIWQNYKTKALKRCIWGEYRLPYTFDFDIGDEDMHVNMSIPNTTVLNGNNGNLKYLTLKKKNIGGKIVRKRVADEIDK